MCMCANTCLCNQVPMLQGVLEPIRGPPPAGLGHSIQGIACAGHVSVNFSNEVIKSAGAQNISPVSAAVKSACDKSCTKKTAKGGHLYGRTCVRPTIPFVRMVLVPALPKWLQSKGQVSTAQEQDALVAGFWPSIKKAIYGHCYDRDHSDCEHYAGWEPGPGHTVTCVGAIEAIANALLEKIYKNLRKLFPVGAPPGRTNLVESWNGVTIRWMPKMVNASAKTHTLQATLAGMHAGERSDWDYDTAQGIEPVTWRRELVSEAASAFGVPVAQVVTAAELRHWGDGVRERAREPRWVRSEKGKRSRNKTKKRGKRRKLDRAGPRELQHAGCGKGIALQHAHRHAAKANEGHKQTRAGASKAHSSGGPSPKKKGQCRCGSTTHSRTNHADCPLNQRAVGGGAASDCAGLEDGSDCEELEDGLFKVELILGDRPGDPIPQHLKRVGAKRKLAAEHQHLVRWLNYGPESDTWEPESHILEPTIAECRQEKSKGQSSDPEGAGSGDHQGGDGDGGAVARVGPCGARFDAMGGEIPGGDLLVCSEGEADL